MNIIVVLWALGIALTFVAWPIIGRFSGASGAWIGTIVVGSTFVTTALFGAKEMVKGPMFTTKALILPLLAGLVNGAAVYFYSVKATDDTVSTGAFIVLVTVGMVILAPMVDWVVNGSPISTKQWFGIAMAVIAIYLLKS